MFLFYEFYCYNSKPTKIHFMGVKLRGIEKGRAEYQMKIIKISVVTCKNIC